MNRTLLHFNELAASGLIAADSAPALQAVVEKFQVAITPAMLGLIDQAHDSGGDAIAAQFVPDAREAQVAPEELADPIGDSAHAPLKGIVHRYADRVLLKPTHVCAVYCRFCFRREQVGGDGEILNEAELAAALDYIRARPAIFEVILSGGDPLVLSPRRLGRIVAAISAIEHVKVLRYHTRLPVAAPERIDTQLIAAIKGRQASYVVLHANHARELSDAALAACARIIDAGMPMLSQTVLLQGVNDDAATLEQLFRALVANRIKPYYLHHPDLARGTSHFRGPIAQGRALMKQLRGRLSGIAQPAYVLDIPGGHGKVPLTADYVHEGDAGTEIEAPDGTRHLYPPRQPKSK